MSGDGKRGAGHWPQATAPILDSTEGSAAFKARFEAGDASHPAWAAAVSLADRLGAEIRGDAGEVYDLQTGQVIKT